MQPGWLCWPAFVAALSCGPPAAPQARPAAPVTPAASSCGPAPGTATDSPARQLVATPHHGPIAALAFSPDGRYLASADAGEIVLWDLRSRLPVHRGPSHAAVDRRREPVGGDLRWLGDARLGLGGHVVDLARESAVALMPAALATGDVWIVWHLDRNRSQAWLGAEDHRLVIYDVDGKPTGELSLAGEERGLLRLALSPARDQLALASDGGNLLLWQLDRPGPPARIAAGGRIGGLAYAAGGRRLFVAVAPPDGQPRHVIDVDTAAPHAVRGVPQSRWESHAVDATIAATADGAHLVIATDDDTRLVDVATGTVTWRVDGGADRVLVSADGSMVAAAHGSTLRLLAGQDGRIVAELGGAPARVPDTVSFVDDDTLVASGVSGGTQPGFVTTWSLASAAPTSQTPARSPLAVAIPGHGILMQHLTGEDDCLAFRYAAGRALPAVASTAAGAGRGFRWRAKAGTAPSPRVRPRRPPPPTRPAWIAAVDGTTACDDDSAALLSGVGGDARLLALGYEVAGRRGGATLKSLATGKAVPLQDVRPAGGMMNSLTVWPSADGTRLAGVRTDLVRTPAGEQGARYVALVWRLDGTRVWSAELKNAAGTHGVTRVSLRGEELVAAANAELMAIDIRSGARRWTLDVGARVTALHQVGGGGPLLVATEDDRLLAVRDGRVTAGAHHRSIAALASDASGRRLAAITPEGVRLLDPRTLATVADLYEFADDEYLVTTPDLRYSGSYEALARVVTAFDRPTEAFSYERFDARLRDPGLVRRRIAGVAPAASRRAALPRPPRVELVGEVPRETTADRITLRARARAAGRVDRVRAFAGGRPVGAADVCAADREITVEVPLRPGANRLALIAYDAAGIASGDLIVDVTRGGAAPAASTLHVVAVGVSSYPLLPLDAQLRVADDDARALLGALRRHAGPGRSYGAIREHLLVEDEVTRDHLRGALAGLADMAPEDVAVVFLAGHGVKTPGGDVVFLTHDVDGTADDARARGVDWRELGRLLAAARGPVLVLLDACHSGHVSRDVLVPGDELAAGLARSGRAGVVVLAAAKGRQQSYEDAWGGHFSRAVIDSLADAATDGDHSGAIEVSELADAVSRRVTAQTGTRQTPWIARWELVGDFRIIDVDAPAPR